MKHKMGQKEVLKFLKKKKRFMTATQIAEEMRYTQSSLNKQLNQLLKYKQVTKKVKKMKIGKQTYKRNVNHFKYRKSGKY